MTDLQQQSEVGSMVSPIVAPVPGERDHSGRRRAWFEAWYRRIGFSVTVPNLSVTDDVHVERFVRQRNIPFYRPATTEASYEAFMAAVGQGNNQTVVDEAMRKQIAWESCDRGYWFWVRIRRSEADGLSRGAEQNFSMEEYVIVSYALAAAYVEAGRDVRWFGRGRQTPLRTYYRLSKDDPMLDDPRGMRMLASSGRDGVLIGTTEFSDFWFSAAEATCYVEIIR